MFGSNPNTTGRTFPSGLPKVSGGMPPHPSHINKLSEGVARNQIRSVTGALVSQTGGGSVLSIDPYVDPTDFPFKCRLINSYVVMTNGCVFLGINNAQIKSAQFFPAMEGDGVDIRAGNEFEFEEGVKSALGDNPTVTKSTEKYASVVYFPAGDASDTAPMVVWMQLTPQLKLRYTSIEVMKQFGDNSDARYAFPIAYIFKNGVAQIIKDNIYPLALTPRLWGYVDKESYPSEDESGNPTTEQGWFFRMTFGTVNSKVPKINGSNVGTKDARELCQDGTNYFYLRCDREEPPAAFPTQVVVERSDEELLNDTGAGYILASIVEVEDNKVKSVLNAISSSLYVEAHKFEPDKVQYYYYGY